MITINDIPAYGDYDKGEPIACGKGYTARIQIRMDECSDAPWENTDGHGPVSDWERRDKRPGELILNEDRCSKRFYDFAEAVKIARRDGWDTKPYNTGTPGERAHRAATADYEFLRKWCAGDWHYIGVIVTVSRHGAEVAQDSLWGIEDCGDYWRETAAEMVNDAIEADTGARKVAAAHKGHETRERHYWECRDVCTAAA